MLEEKGEGMKTLGTSVKRLSEDESINTIIDLHSRGVIDVELRNALLLEFVSPTRCRNQEQQDAASALIAQMRQSMYDNRELLIDERN